MPDAEDGHQRWQNGYATALVEPALLVRVTVIWMVKLPRVPHTPEQVGPVHEPENPPDHANVTGVGES